jgi:cytochrome c-type biogenesis protein CcmH
VSFRLRRSIARAGLAALVLACALAAAAQERPVAAGRGGPPPSESGWGYALANELMSPWCPGFALPDCSSGYAADLRLWILEQERLGRSEDDVKAEILARYGEKMLQAPRAEGRGIFAYAIPAAAVLAGLAVLVAFLRRQGGTDDAAGAGALPGTPDAAALARVDAEIAQLERAND